MSGLEYGALTRGGHACAPDVGMLGSGWPGSTFPGACPPHESARGRGAIWVATRAVRAYLNIVDLMVDVDARHN